MENPEVVRVFDEVADLLEIEGANPFRVRAYRTAARTVGNRGKPVRDLPANELAHLPGIGKDLAGKIGEILKTGDLPLRQELSGKVPAGLRDLMHVPGLGPKRAVTLHQRLHIDSLDKLRK